MGGAMSVHSEKNHARISHATFLSRPTLVYFRPTVSF